LHISDEKIQLIPLFSSINKTEVAKISTLTEQDILNYSAIDCLYLIGENLRLSRKYSTVIVQDQFLPDIEFDLFLPSTNFVETESSFVNIEQKKITMPKVVEPTGKAKPDEWIIRELARMISPGQELLQRPEASSAITKATPKPNRGYPLYLVVRENSYRYRGSHLSSLMTGFKRFRVDQALWINPADAVNLELKDGAAVKVASKDWIQPMVVSITDKVPEGILLTFHNPALGITNDQCVRIEPTS